MKAFMGLIIAMGIKRLPSYSSSPILGAPELVKGFPLNRFKQLLGNLHFNDNDKAVPRGTPGHYKLYKIRPILDATHARGSLIGASLGKVMFCRCQCVSRILALFIR